MSEQIRWAKIRFCINGDDSEVFEYVVKVYITPHTTEEELHDAVDYEFEQVLCEQGLHRLYTYGCYIDFTKLVRLDIDSINYDWEPWN